MAMSRFSEGPGRLLPGPSKCSVAGAEVDARHRGEHLLLVVDGAALVRGHVRGVVRRDDERVDVVRGDGEPEVVADEPAARRAGIPGAGARVLRETAEMLSGLLRIPRVLRDPHVPVDRDRAGA